AEVRGERRARLVREPARDPAHLARAVRIDELDARADAAAILRCRIRELDDEPRPIGADVLEHAQRAAAFGHDEVDVAVAVEVAAREPTILPRIGEPSAAAVG